MRSPVFPRRRFLAALLSALPLAVLATLALSVPAAADGTSVFFPTPISPNGRELDTLYRYYITPPALVIFVLVEAWIVLVILRFRRRHPDHYGKQYHGNVPLEIAWFVVPTIIVTVIAYVSFVTLQNNFTAEAANRNVDMRVAVKGYQFYWTYTYEDGPAQGATVQNQLVVPVDTMVHLDVTSDNVIHSWWVPAIFGKTDAVPGYTNQTWFKIDGAALSDCRGYGKRDDKTGGCVWQGECAELCGTGHSQMLITVLAVPKDQFGSWAAQAKAPKPTPSPAKPRPSPSGSPSSPNVVGGSPSPSASPSPPAPGGVPSGNPSPSASP